MVTKNDLKDDLQDIINYVELLEVEFDTKLDICVMLKKLYDKIENIQELEYDADIQDQ
jgi:hypothetical protein